MGDVPSNQSQKKHQILLLSGLLPGSYTTYRVIMIYFIFPLGPQVPERRIVSRLLAMGVFREVPYSLSKIREVLEYAQPFGLGPRVPKHMTIAPKPGPSWPTWNHSHAFGVNLESVFRGDTTKLAQLCIPPPLSHFSSFFPPFDHFGIRLGFYCTRLYCRGSLLSWRKCFPELPPVTIFVSERNVYFFAHETISLRFTGGVLSKSTLITLVLKSYMTDDHACMIKSSHTGVRAVK